jgi:RHS repeat-associated protein
MRRRTPRTRRARSAIVFRPALLPLEARQLLSLVADPEGDVLASALGVALSPGVPYVHQATIGDGLYGPSDVDLYRVQLSAGAVLSADIDAQALDEGGALSGLDSTLRVFDDAGYEVAHDENAFDPQTGAPGADAALSYRAAAAGTYFLGVSGTVNRAYDPARAGSGPAGAGADATGAYRLELRVAQSPPAPAGVSAAALPDGTIRVSWSPSAGAEGYFVERRRAGGAWGLVAVLAADATGFTDGGLLRGTPYTYRVTATGADATLAPSATVTAVPVGDPSSEGAVGTAPVGSTGASGQAGMSSQDDAGATASFVGSDATTQGDWPTAYGGDGYLLANGAGGQLPAYASVAVAGQLNYTWAASTSDVRAPLTAPGTTTRAATCWYTTPGANTFDIDVNLADGQAHEVSLYALDWDFGRVERIDVVDAGSGTVLDSETLSGFEGGAYLSWTLSGHVVLQVVSTNAVVSALFFGGAATSAPPTATAVFAGADTTTQGNWPTAYGGDGYLLANGAGGQLPAYASVAVAGQLNYTWAASTSDVRAPLTAPGATTRAATCWYTTPGANTFSIDVNLTDGQAHRVSLYALDWDPQGRSERIDVVDAASGAVLDSESLASFQNGAYLSWTLSGHVVLRVVSTNAVVSALFFGGAASAHFVGSDATTQGNWPSAYGADGYLVLGGTAALPAYAVVTPSGQGSYHWDLFATDARAPVTGLSGAHRAAAFWSTAPASLVGASFTIDVNLTDGQAHEVSLYALDWDSTTRAERVEVLDAASGAVLDSRDLASFHDGTYLTWTLRGHVVLRVVNTGPTYAVVSGLFFGGAAAAQPVAAPDGYTVGRDGALTVTAAAGVLANDADPQGDPLTATLVQGAAHGTLALAADGSFTYTPDPGFLGIDRFLYRASDGQHDSYVAAATIHGPAAAFLQGIAFDDRDGDGRLDAADPRLAGASVSLYAGATLLGTALTDARGSYRFDAGNVAGGALVPGTYRLVETPPPGYANSATQADLSVVQPVTASTPRSIDVQVGDPAAAAPANWTLASDGSHPPDGGEYFVDGATRATYLGPIPITIAEPDIGYTATYPAYCEEVGVDFDSAPRPFTARPLDQVVTNGNAGRIGYLVNHYGTAPLSADEGAGLQLAIWQLRYGDLRDIIISLGYQAPVVAAYQAYLAESAGRDEPALYLDGGGAQQSMLAAGSLNFANVAASEVPAAVPLGSLSGTVYLDVNDDGRQGPGEAGLGGVTVTLSGVQDDGRVVTATAVTARDGTYRFEHLAPGTYALAETPPAGSIDAKDTVGSLGGTVGRGRFTGIVVPAAAQGLHYLFGHERPPVFTSTPLKAVAVGQTYAYTLAATDPDGDPLTYTVVSGPAGLSPPDDAHRITWTPTTAGVYAVRLRVSDGRGGVAEQPFDLTVVAAVPNRPPVFTSDPVVDAYVGQPYTYRATAVDPDFDTPLIFTLDENAPTGMLPTDPRATSAAVAWTPTADELGPHDVRIRVDDQHGGVTPQSYTVVVHPAPGNHPPMIISQPITRLDLPGGNPRTYTYPVQALDPDNDPLTYILESGPADAFLDAHSGLLEWRAAAPGHVDFVVRVEDGRGGVDSQPVPLDVVVVTTGEIDGRVGAVDLTVRGTDAIQLAGRTDLTIPPIGTTDPDYPLTRHTYNPQDPGALTEETVPGSVPAEAGETFAFQVSGSVAYDYTYPTSHPIGADGSDVLIDDPGPGYAEHGPGWQTRPGGVGGTHRVAPAGGGRSATWRAAGLPAGTYQIQALWSGDSRHAAQATYRIYDGETLVATCPVNQQQNSGGMPSPVWNTLAWAGVSQGDLRVVLDSTEDGEVEADQVRITALWTYNGTADLNSVGGISGYRGPIGSLVGVFLSDQIPAAAASPGLDFSPAGLGTAFTTLAPALGQVFFIGDGLAGTGTGPVQTFVAPPGATRLFVGAIDGFSFRGTPGAYDDNNGQFQVTILQGAAGLAGWTVYRDDDNDGQHDAGEPTALTDAGGRYALTGLTAGTAAVTEVVPAGWLPYEPASGSRTVTLAAGGLVTGIDFGNRRADPDAANHAPRFTGTDVTDARVGERYGEIVTGTDADGDALIFDLPVRPVGMAIDGATGTIAWEPTPDQAGYQDVVVRVRDGRGGVDLRAFRVHVLPANQPPQITSTPVKTALGGHAYAYQVRAVDPDGNTPLTYALDDPDGSIAALGILINPTTGTLTWDHAVARVGPYHLNIAVRDVHGAEATQEYDLQVQAGTGGPPVFAAHEIWQTLQLGRTYRYQARAIDPDGDTIAYDKAAAGDEPLPAGLEVDPATGLVSWTPTADLFTVGQTEATVSFCVTATDRIDGDAEPQLVHLTVVEQGSNHDPSIAWTGPANATVDRLYRSTAQGSDPDHDPLAWSLVGTYPAGLVLDPLTGVLAWVPTDDQIGPHDLTVRVEDGQGGWATRTVTITVRGADLPPRFDPTPPPLATEHQPYTFQVRASDPEGESLTYALVPLPGVTYPADLSVSAVGLLSWADPTPTGPQRVAVQVQDEAGNVIVQGFTLIVAAATTNHPPAITSPPGPDTTTDATYHYQATASDPDPGDTVTFRLGSDTQGWWTMAPDGTLRSLDPGTGQPGPEPAGTYWVTVVATDNHGASGSLRFPIAVRADAAPTLAAIGPQALVVGQPFRYDVQADDADLASGDTLSYSLTGPNWLAIDAAGRITGMPTATGTSTFQVTVTDAAGQSASQTFAVSVTADTTPPRVQLGFPDQVVIGEPFTILVAADDNAGVASVSLTVDDKPVTLDGHGAATLTLQQPGDHTIVAKAIDVNGVPSLPVSAHLNVLDPAAPALTATLDLLRDPRESDPSRRDHPFETADGPAVITAPMDLLGTAADPQGQAVTYTLACAPLDSDAFQEFASGQTPVNGGVLGRFDPTMLANGAYTIRLTVHRPGVPDAVAEQVVNVAGNLKLGNLHLSFTDLVIPVAGIPITTTRTYDTLNRDQDGDFGYGWTLDEGDFQLQVSRADGTLGALDLHAPLQYGTRIVLTRPGQAPEGFTFHPRQIILGDMFAAPLSQPAFDPDPGVTSRLTVSYAELMIDDRGEYVCLDGTPYNPADPVANTSRTLTLTTHQGLTYVVDAATGKLATVTDRVGNTLYFDETGIASSTGRKVTFVRDPQTHRITAIIDPDNHEIRYDYGAFGNLTAVNDRISSAKPEGQRTPTTFDYGADPTLHRLDHIDDPLGRPAVTTEYDDQGRIKHLTDAAGKSTDYDWHSDTLVQSVTDQLQHTTELTLDARGNVLREVDPEGVTTTRTYDAANHLLTQTTVVGLEDTPENGEHDDLTTKYTYDDFGNQKTITDPRGNVTYFTYNAYGEPETIASFDGTTTNHYDQYGLLRSVTTSDGRATRFDYDAQGNPTQVYDDRTGALFVTNTYNDFGDLTSSTPTAGRATYFDYDAVGNRIATWYFDGEGADQVQVLDRTYYTDANQVQGTAHLVLPYDHFLTSDLAHATLPQEYVKWTTATEYNVLGQVEHQTDQLQRTTEPTYDLRGNLIQTRTRSEDEHGNPAYLVTRTVYDAAGRVLFTTDPYVEGATAPITGTLTEYDTAGRVTATGRYKDPVIREVGSGATLQYVLDSPGTPISGDRTDYDYQHGGRVADTVDEFGLETQQTYDAFGEVTESRTQAVDQTGATDRAVWLVTRTVYDDHGRAVLTTDPYVDGATDPVYATRTVYDDQGRAYLSIRLKGVAVALAADGETTLTQPGRELWRTQTLYDDRGRVQETIAADGEVTDYEYDDLNRRKAVIGPPVILDGQTVRLRTETVYDAQGRVHIDRTNVRQLADGTIVRTDARETTYDYDAAGNLRQTTFADGTSISATYDDLGRKRTETNQLQQTRTFAYDDQGRLWKVTLPAVPDPLHGGTPTHPIYEYGYDAQGNQTLIRDPLGHETRFEYDGQGHELTRTLPLGFGLDGRKDTDDDPPAGSFTENFTYDDRGRETLHISFEGAVTEFIYDQDTGRLSQQLFFPSEAAYAEGTGTPAETWTYKYDAFGHTAQVSQQKAGEATRTTTTSYDGEGRVTQIASPQGTVNYRYDDLGRHVRTFTGTDPDHPIDETDYGYDALGRLQTVTVRDGQALTTPETTTYGYDLVGNLAWQRQPSGVLAVFTYDELNRLTDRTDYAPGAQPDDVYLETRAKLARYAYTLNDDGTRKDATETTWFDDNSDSQPEEHTSTTTWTYDDLGRLTDEAIDSYVNDQDQTEHFVYDLAGNRLEQTVHKGTSDADTTYQYDANDRLRTEQDDTNNDGTVDVTTTYGYTGTEQASKEVQQGATITSHTEYGYDLQGRMQTVTVTTYTDGAPSRIERTTYAYDEAGIRVSAVNEVDADANGTFETGTRTDYLNDPDNPTGYSQVLKETTTDLTTQQVQKTVAYTLGLDIISQTTTQYTVGQPGATVTLVLGYDGHGSTRVLTDLAGAVAQGADGSRQVFTYDAYGNLLNMAAAQAATSLLYSGESFDAHIGMQYLRRRWYDPATGRFNTLDSFFGNLQDPQSLHKYAYTHANPINSSDPVGLSSESEITVTMAIQATLDALNIYGFASNSAQAFKYAYQGAQLIRFGDTPDGLAALTLAVVHGAFAWLNLVGLRGGGILPPPGLPAEAISISGNAITLSRLITLSPELAEWAIKNLLPALVQLGSAGVAFQGDLNGSPYDNMLFSVKHDRYLNWVRPGAKGRLVKMPWASESGLGNRVLDDYDAATETGFEANTPWSEVPAEDVFAEVQRKLEEFDADFTKLVDPTLKPLDPVVKRIVWFGPEDLPTSGPFSELRDAFESAKKAGIPIEYWVVPGPP